MEKNKLKRYSKGKANEKQGSKEEGEREER